MKTGVFQIKSKRDLTQVYEMLFSHKIISGTEIDPMPMDEFYQKFSKKIITFGFFENGELQSFIITRKLEEISCWFIQMMSVKNRNVFNYEQSKLAELFDAALEYWESKNVFLWIVIQSIKHRSVLNTGISNLSKKTKDYQIPGVTLEIIKKGTVSTNSLVYKCTKGIPSTKDQVVKLVYHKSKLYDLEK